MSAQFEWRTCPVCGEKYLTVTLNNHEHCPKCFDTAHSTGICPVNRQLNKENE